MIWRLSHRADPRAAALADRHYSRQSPGTPQFVAPGSCVVLLSTCGLALWVSLRQQIVKHAWPDAWVCALFRNEGAGLSSTLILQAVAATRAVWGAPPPEGMLTFVDPDQVRHKRDPGRCFRRAGFRPVGGTAAGLIALVLPADDMPPAEPAVGFQHRFAAEGASACRI